MKKYTKIKGFSLAESLISLLIISIVILMIMAVMTKKANVSKATSFRSVFACYGMPIHIANSSGGNSIVYGTVEEYYAGNSSVRKRVIYQDTTGAWIRRTYNNSEMVADKKVEKIAKNATTGDLEFTITENGTVTSGPTVTTKDRFYCELPIDARVEEYYILAVGARKNNVEGEVKSERIVPSIGEKFVIELGEVHYGGDPNSLTNPTLDGKETVGNTIVRIDETQPGIIAKGGYNFHNNNYLPRGTLKDCKFVQEDTPCTISNGDGNYINTSTYNGNYDVENCIINADKTYTCYGKKMEFYAEEPSYNLKQNPNFDTNKTNYPKFVKMLQLLSPNKQTVIIDRLINNYLTGQAYGFYLGGTATEPGGTKKVLIYSGDDNDFRNFYVPEGLSKVQPIDRKGAVVIIW